MTRTRATAKDQGTRFATTVARYLADHLDDDGIERRDKNGNKDRGDITGLRHMGQRVVVECKNVMKPATGTWLGEAEIERRNDDAGVGLVAYKRVGKGRPGDQLVLMTLADFVSLLSGTRPDEES